MADDDRRYASVPERITWTTGFRLAIDKHVLGVLSTFANFRTGRHADMKLATLAKRAKVPRSTLLRSLQRLKDDEWIFAKPQHRRPTVYDINEAKLATHWMEAKLVEPITNLSPTGGTQDAEVLKSLSPTHGTQDPVLSPTHGTQDPVLSPTGGTPSPVRTSDPLYRDHKEPALRAAQADASKADPVPTVPHQLTFGVLGPADGRAPPARDPNWRQRFAETIRSALRQAAEGRKHG
jgi:hypothetical protein